MRAKRNMRNKTSFPSLASLDRHLPEVAVRADVKEYCGKGMLTGGTATVLSRPLADALEAELVQTLVSERSVRHCVQTYRTTGRFLYALLGVTRICVTLRFLFSTTRRI